MPYLNFSMKFFLTHMLLCMKNQPDNTQIIRFSVTAVLTLPCCVLSEPVAFTYLYFFPPSGLCSVFYSVSYSSILMCSSLLFMFNCFCPIIPLPSVVFCCTSVRLCLIYFHLIPPQYILLWFNLFHCFLLWFKLFGSILFHSILSGLFHSCLFLSSNSSPFSLSSFFPHFISGQFTLVNLFFSAFCNPVYSVTNTHIFLGYVKRPPLCTAQSCGKTK